MTGAREVTSAAPGSLLARAFFARDATIVGPELVGMLLCRPRDGLWARVVEVEAYTRDDPACHAYRRRTERNAPLWGPPGHAYVYRSYGVHWCFNVATGSDGDAQGCLIRAAQPLVGIGLMRTRRRGADESELLRGPAKLCEAYAITGEMSGRDVCVDGPVGFRDDGTRPAVVEGPRVGVSHAADRPWRFSIDGSRWVSPYRRSPRAPR